MPFEPRCSRCGRHVFGNVEVDMLLCNRCADEDVERYERRREWDHYHPGQPMPASERLGIVDPYARKEERG